LPECLRVHGSGGEGTHIRVVRREPHPREEGGRGNRVHLRSPERRQPTDVSDREGRHAHHAVVHEDRVRDRTGSHLPMMKKLSGERGNVLVTAILLMAVMLSVGMAVAATVDTQTNQSRKERERESTFNLAEAALSAQTFILGRRGTGTPTNPYPVGGCNGVSTNLFCPANDTLMRSYTGDASQV